MPTRESVPTDNAGGVARVTGVPGFDAATRSRLTAPPDGGCPIDTSRFCTVGVEASTLRRRKNEPAGSLPSDARRLSCPPHRRASPSTRILPSTHTSSLPISLLELL